MRKTMLFAMMVLLSLSLVGCNVKTETARRAIDRRYTEAWSEVKTDYAHKYSLLRGEFVLVPNVHTVTHPERYEVLYLVTYDDGSTAKHWKEVSYEEYAAFGKDGDGE